MTNSHLEGGSAAFFFAQKFNRSYSTTLRF
jgi:hypothetical protein